MKNLILKYLFDSLNDEELLKLSKWLEEPKNREIFKSFVKTNLKSDYALNSPDKEKALNRMLEQIEAKDHSKVRKLSYTILKYAAIVVIALISGYLLKNSIFDNLFKDNTPSLVKTDIFPGANKATLTLDDGSEIILDKGNIYQTPNANSNGEEIIYETNTNNNEEVSYNYLTIPRGGQFFVKLSDGTNVWLNSETQLKYPVNFIDGKTREVELVYGEAYFDVSHSTEHNGASFVVKNQMQNIEVLGTEFNIKAYKDNPIYYTTLIEGKVNVSNDVSQKILSPGEQSIVNGKSDNINIRKVDVNYEVAWKNGLFMFKKESLQEMLKTLSRWYDVEVVFENEERKGEIFSGMLKRSDKLEDLLNNLEETGDVKFLIENQKVIVR